MNFENSSCSATEPVKRSPSKNIKSSSLSLTASVLLAGGGLEEIMKEPSPGVLSVCPVITGIPDHLSRSSFCFPVQRVLSEDWRDKPQAEGTGER